MAAAEGSAKGLVSSPVITERSSVQMTFNVTDEGTTSFSSNGSGAKSGREPSSAGQSSATVAEGSRRFLFSGGLLIGTEFFLPTIHLQLRLRDKFYLGLRSSYFRESLTVDIASSALGLMLTSGIFFTESTSSAPYAEVALGGYSFSASDSVNREDSRIALATYVVGGWMWRPNNGVLTLNGALGMHYVTTPEITLISIGAVGLRPLVVLSVGLSF